LSPSSQACPLGAATVLQTPVHGLQAWTWHGTLEVPHCTTDFGTTLQCPVLSQIRCRHLLPLSQSLSVAHSHAGNPLQVLDGFAPPVVLQASPMVQASPSSQALPGAARVVAHLPVFGSHALTWQGPPSGHWMALPALMAHRHGNATLSHTIVPAHGSAWPVQSVSARHEHRLCGPALHVPVPSTMAQTSPALQGSPSSHGVPGARA